MKTKIIALAMVAIMMVSLVSVAFARPVAKCPDCNGEFRSHKYQDWHWVDVTSKRRQTDMAYQVWCEEQLTDIIYCSNGSHNHSKSRNGHWRNVSWLEGYFK